MHLSRTYSLLSDINYMQADCMSVSYKYIRMYQTLICLVLVSWTPAHLFGLWAVASFGDSSQAVTYSSCPSGPLSLPHRCCSSDTRASAGEDQQVWSTVLETFLLFTQVRTYVHTVCTYCLLMCK